jgi:hypothetical protein
MLTARQRLQFSWITIVYIVVIAVVLYPSVHEGFGAKIIVWNCVPPTVGLILITTALAKSKPRRIVAATFALLTAIVATFFSAAWVFTALDLDPHSATTKLVFVFAPIFSLGLATIASCIAWLFARIR